MYSMFMFLLIITFKQMVVLVCQGFQLCECILFTFMMSGCISLLHGSDYALSEHSTVTVKD